MKVIKRSGVEVDFDRDKIYTAIRKSNESVEQEHQMPIGDIERITSIVENRLHTFPKEYSVEEIQDTVESELMQSGYYYVARSYVRYRYDREKLRMRNTTDSEILSLIELQNEEAKQENSNKNPVILSTQRDYMAGAVSRDLTKRILLPEDIVKAHEAGEIHFHDSDYFAQHMHNCCLVNMDDILQNGTVISGTMIEKPHRFSTAATIATQVIAQVASNQYGGQTVYLSHLSPFVNESRKRFSKKFPEANPEFIEQLVRDDVETGVQTIQYQINTLLTSNGQTPFISLYMNINDAEEGQARDDLAMCIEEVLKQRIQGVKNEVGVWVSPAFPKLLYVLDENNAEPGSEYYWLTELAAKCTAKRMVPDYISAKKMRELKGDVYGCMGCRSFLTPDRFTDAGLGNIGKAKNYVEGKHIYPSRFNQGVVTLNLADIALSSGGDFDKFWKIFDERTDLCYRALMCRHNRLKGTPSDVAPILWQYGALARLDKGEVIDPLLYNGYSTISLGYAALYECVKYMTGYSHTDPRGKNFALEVMKKLNEKCTQWKAETNIDFSLYGTPLESTTYRFAKCLQKKFGIIPGITDRNYVTNSYHVHVTEEIDAFTKLGFEAEFQELSPGGCISYVEVPNMQNNIPAVLEVMRFIYHNIMYAELNTKSDYCMECGFDGEIKIVEEDGQLIWECPQCHNRDQRKMNVCRRTCGYIGTNFWNHGRTEEIRDRVLHL